MKKELEINLLEFEHALLQTLYNSNRIAALAQKIEETIHYPIYFMNSFWEFYASSYGVMPNDIIKISDLLHSAQIKSQNYNEYLTNKASLSSILGQSPAFVYIPKRKKNFLFAYSYMIDSNNGIAVLPENQNLLKEIPDAYLDTILRIFSLAQTLDSVERSKQHINSGWSKIIHQIISGKISDKTQLLNALQINSLTIYIKSFVIFVFSVRSESIDETQIYDKLSLYLQTLQHYHLWFAYEGNVVMLLDDDIYQKNTQQYIRSDSFQSMVAELELYVGYSNTFFDLLDAAHAYEDAHMAARFSRRWDTAVHISSYEYCKLYDLLYHINGTKHSLKQYVSQSILQIQQYDKSHDSNYFKTLELLFENHMNLTNTSAQLFIHKSTLFYRMQQMSKLFQIDWDDATMTLHLQLSLYIMKYFLVE